MIIKLGPVALQYLVVVTANLTLFQIGITIGWLSPAMVKLRDENQTALPEPITETEQSWIVSISSLTGLIAGTFISYLANSIGRKYSIILAVLPRIISCFLILFSSQVWMLLLGRAICGISDLCIISIMAPYASEIASKEIRGSLGTLSQISSALGSMLILSVGPFVSYLALNLIQTITVVVTFVPLLFLPESPYFLSSKGKTEDAIKVLTYLRGDEISAKEELKEYSMNKEEKTPWNVLFKDRIIIKCLVIVVILAISSQMTGHNAVSFNLQTIFESTGTSVAPEISSVIIGCIQVFACLCTILTTDKFGRKPVLSITFFISAIGMIGLGTFFKLKDDDREITGFLNYLPLISLILVIFSFNAGVGALALTLMAELFEGPARAAGVSVGAFVATVFTFLTTRYLASVSNSIGSAATYWMFGGCCVASCLFIIFCVPETKGKTFSKIQMELGRR